MVWANHGLKVHLDIDDNTGSMDDGWGTSRVKKKQKESPGFCIS